MIRLVCVEGLRKKERGEWGNWDYAKGGLFFEDKEISAGMHANIGSTAEFPFAFRLPTIGRETYHGIDKNLLWLLVATVYIQGIHGLANTLTEQKEVFVSNSTRITKETVREVVLIPCSYCSGLMPQTSVFCPNCGARRKN